MVWDKWENNRRKTISFGKSEAISTVPQRDAFGAKNSIDVPNRRSTRGTINQAFIFDELEVVEDEIDEVFGENGIEAPVSTNSNDFEVTSFRQCVKHIYRSQGFLSFWNGNLANCLRYMKVAK